MSLETLRAACGIVFYALRNTAVERVESYRDGSKEPLPDAPSLEEKVGYAFRHANREKLNEHLKSENMKFNPLVKKVNEHEDGVTDLPNEILDLFLEQAKMNKADPDFHPEQFARNAEFEKKISDAFSKEAQHFPEGSPEFHHNKAGGLLHGLLAFNNEIMRAEAKRMQTQFPYTD